MPETTREAARGSGAPHRAGAFDIRAFIALLIGIYGLVLVLTGLFSSDGRTINLASGAGMLVVSALFLTWARLRPVVVPTQGHADDGPTEGGGSTGE